MPKKRSATADGNFFMQIYLDNASSVPCEKHILERFAVLASEYFANQESLSCHGRKSAKAVKEAEEKIFTLLSADKAESGGVLSGNTGSSVLAASIHALGSFLKGGVVTSCGEHSSVLCALKRTSALYRFPVYYCPVGRDGELDRDHLKDLLKKEKIGLAAFHHIQSETGCIQDLAAIRNVLDEYSPETLFLADTVQSAGKYPLLWKEAKLDLAFVSGQKIGCTGGGCVLYRKKFARLFTSLRGSTHLPGRCIPAHILLLAEILEKLVPEMETNRRKMEKMKYLLLEQIKKNDIPFVPTLSPEKTSSYILHGITTPYQGAILTRMLTEKNISAAPGSACESETGEVSRILKEMGIKKNDLYNVLRISFWLHNTEEEIRYFVPLLKACTLKY